MKTNSRLLYELETAGLIIDAGKFPYVYHHDYVRHSGITRFEVAQRLRAISTDLNEYDYSVCYGAILSLISEQPESITKTVCDTMQYVKELSVYNWNVCGRDEMREIIGITV